MSTPERPGSDSADFLLLEARTADTYLGLAQRSFDDVVIRCSATRARRTLTAMTYFLNESALLEEDAHIIRRLRDDLRERLNTVIRLGARSARPRDAGQR